MDINTQLQAQTASVRQALNTSILRKAMNKDAETVLTLMQQVNAETPKTTNPDLGKFIDVSV